MRNRDCANCTKRRVLDPLPVYLVLTGKHGHPSTEPLLKLQTLQDPVARTVSSHNMEYAANGRCYGDTCHRYYPHLLEEFRNNRDFNFTTPSHMEKLKGKCNFNDKVC